MNIDPQSYLKMFLKAVPNLRTFGIFVAQISKHGANYCQTNLTIVLGKAPILRTIFNKHGTILLGQPTGKTQMM